MPTLQFHLDQRSPFARHFRLSKGARLPALLVQLLDGDTPVDLSTATVTFSMVDDAGVLKVNAVAGTLVDGPNGKVSYAWAAADVDTVKDFWGQFKITVGGKDYLVPDNEVQRLRIEVVAKVEASP